MNPVDVIARHKLKLRGVIQVGSHHGEEQPMWEKLQLESIHFEPQRSNVAELLRRYPKAYVIPVALGNENCRALLYTETANGGQSSSLLKPADHLTEFPGIEFNGEEQVMMMRLDDYDRFIGGILTAYDFLYIDAQGYELEVLKGAEWTLRGIEAIITEVNRGEMFKGCPMVEEIDAWLAVRGFRRVETNWHSRLFGDALYIRVGA